MRTLSDDWRNDRSSKREPADAEHTCLRCVLAFCVGLLALVSSLPCAGAEAPVSFNRDIRPIFSQTCFACHGFDEDAREADLRLDLRQEALREVIVPGNSADSPVYQRISSEDADERMPPADFHTQLSKREIGLIKRWIDEGAEYEAHWSFIPPQRPTIPEGQQAIDYLVRKRLQAEQISPADRADRATLIRRVSLDLCGIPPSPKLVSDFVNDQNDHSTAWGRVVDKLLESPAFAEHRTRYWLDASRYADTSGYQYDRIRHQWVWRDWVIHAFDSNMPFDQFTIEQMAGDLLPDSTPQSRLATGFHRNHPITIEGGIIDEEYRTEYVMDRVVTTSTTWMGLTFLCARCHDHKYDPINQDDFYSFFAFFNSVPERGMNGFAPKTRIASPLNPIDFAALEREVSAAKAARNAELKRLSESFPVWEAKLRERVELERDSVRLDKLEAGGGTKLTLQDDGSILAHGPNPATNTYRLELTVGDKPLQAIRIEALAHADHVNGSTGRGHNGNFVLSEVTLESASAGESEFQPVPISEATADYEQANYPISAAIDGKTGRGGWAVDGNTRFEDRSAEFTLTQAIQSGSRVRVSLIHTWGGSHTIGRFRITTGRDGQAPTPKDVQATLAISPEQREPAARQRLEQFLAGRFGNTAYRELEAAIVAAETGRKTAIEKFPETMVLKEMPKSRETFVLMRGEYDKPIKSRRVQPAVPALLGSLPDDAPANRLGLAQWLVSRDNPLTARVTANRFWAQLFGTGLVKTVEDFGAQGEYPAHPELLDWLAVEFMDSGWDVKHLFRTIVTSETYCQSSVLTPEASSRDPENRLLARGPRYRLDAESIRDSALAVSGLLDSTIGGPSVYPYHPEGLWLEINNRPGYSRAYPHSQDASALYRRSLYTFWKRTVPPPSMAAFDAPEREFCMVQRSRTNTPIQAFVLLHDPQFVEAARNLGERMILEASNKESTTRLAHGFQLCFARSPEPNELNLLQQTFESKLIHFRENPAAATKLLAVGESPVSEQIDPVELAAWSSVARVLLNLSEFITKP